MNIKRWISEKLIRLAIAIDDDDEQPNGNVLKDVPNKISTDFKTFDKIVQSFSKPLYDDIEIEVVEVDFKGIFEEVKKEADTGKY